MAPHETSGTVTETGRREQNKSANRDAILRAARSVFLELGYDAVTIRDVIRRTELSCGTFYNYFPDKETLFRALLAERMSRFTEMLRASRVRAATLEDFVRLAYENAFGQVASDPEFFAMMFRNEPVIRAMFSDSVMGLMLGTLRDDLREAVARRMLPEVDLDALTATMFGAGFELCRLFVEKPGRNAADVADFATRLVLGGLTGLAGPAAAERPRPAPG